ncbi:Vacuolar protein sorting 55 family protein [Perilla frutescens var. hirtella]|uniref:Vacuolar protein sorting 55 family protein n=1 Tax=Perilla frutescens var. hirtella TaxID=608512 RepID=A0AAD4IW52_PERFH|nr:Vacuolar protein sorting 55 family protein [Perilla frutescens var. hirtella]
MNCKDQQLSIFPVLLLAVNLSAFHVQSCRSCIHVFIQHPAPDLEQIISRRHVALHSFPGYLILINIVVILFSHCFLACAIYNNWWPMLSALMYVLVPMPCLFFGGGSTQFLISRDGGGWVDAAKFLTGASAVGSMAIPIILRHAGLIGTGAMFIEFTSFFIFVCTVLCFHRASLDDEW